MWCIFTYIIIILLSMCECCLHDWISGNLFQIKNRMWNGCFVLWFLCQMTSEWSWQSGTTYCNRPGKLITHRKRKFTLATAVPFYKFFENCTCQLETLGNLRSRIAAVPKGSINLLEEGGIYLELCNSKPSARVSWLGALRV